MSFTADPLDRAVVFACDFRPRVVGGVNVMPNFGKAGGAPKWLTLGDGVTANTFPVPLNKWGARFTGTQYVNTGVVDRYEFNNSFSLYYNGSINDQSGLCSVISTLGNVLRGISLESAPIISYGAGIFIIDAYTTRTLSKWTSLYSMRASKSIVCTYDGTAVTASAIALYLDAKRAVETVQYSSALSDTIKFNLPFLLGRRNGTSPNALVGTGYAFGIFDGLLSPRDIEILDRTVRSNIAI